MRIRLNVDDAINIVEIHGGSVADQPDNPPFDIEVDVEVNLTMNGLDEIARAARDALNAAGYTINPPGAGWPH